MSMPPPPPPIPPGYQAYQAAPGIPQFASWGSRVGGHIINGLSAFVFAVPAIVAFFAGPREYQACTVNDRPGICKLPTSTGWAIIIVLGVLGLVAFMALYGRAIARDGQFWGHKAVGVRIVDARTGGNIGAGKAIARYLIGHWIDGLVCYLGFLWPLWDANKQTWSDKMFGTYSVRA
ncbi:MAG: RDD family protein [Ilumatobacteraceae bacterium]|nr:RDD family protein [Ilumatobacter sp.]MCB0984994.1 RDD family protein [Ilumatobacter sp.]